jgi:hypothetical protein
VSVFLEFALVQEVFYRKSCALFPPDVIQALREALRHIHWYKNDLRRFLLTLELPIGLVDKQPWHDPKEYKVRIAGNVIDSLLAMGVDGLGPMRRLIKAVLDIPDFDHLLRLEDGAAKVQTARKNVESLRACVYRHDRDFHRREKSKGERKHTPQTASTVRTAPNQAELTRLNDLYTKVASNPNYQERGRQFQSFLTVLFDSHDLHPRGTFRLEGQEIDGAFEFDNTQFLLEAKWEKDRIGNQPLESFSRRVEKRLENTLGLFISLNGYTTDGMKALKQGTRPSIILMDGEDLAYVLQGLVDLTDLLKRKIRYAAQFGEPFFPVRQMFE